MYNRTITDWFIESKEVIFNLSRFRWIDIGASVIFLLLISCGRKAWLNTLTLMMFFEGLQILFFPKSMNFWITGELDATHLLLIRVLGLAILMWCFTYFLIGKSTDSTTETSFLLSLSVTMLTSLLAKGYYLTHLQKGAPVRIDYEPMTTVFYTTMLFAVGTLFHTFKCNDWGGYGEQSSHANFHQRVLFVFLLFVGILMYTLPQWAAKEMGDVKADAIHAFLLRALGGFILGNAILVTRSANFLRNNDRDAVILCQWLFLVSWMAVAWYDASSRFATMEWRKIIVAAIIDFSIFLNTTGALNRDVSVVKRVVVPRFKAFPQDVRSLFKFKRA